jgi:transglutaminase-like putative cysteine protease
MVITTTDSNLFPRLSTLIGLLVILILVVLPHLFHLAWWIIPTFLILLLWRYLIFQQQRFFLSPTLRFSLALLVLLGIFLSYGTWFGRDAGIAFLVVLCGLKLLEMNSHRDAFLLVFLSYFLVITHFLYSQAIFIVIYLGIVTWLITATLISLSDNNDKLLNVQRLRLSATLLVQALPLMAVLFFLFPRLTGTLWSLPKDAYSGVTGLSDSISLGQVNQLSLSNDIAFRVKFHDKIPPPNYLYWRGPVLWWTNGRDWHSRIPYHKKINDLPLHPIGEAINYTVTLEPHNQRWLFALDLPVQAPPQGYLSIDHQILAYNLVHQRLIYQLSSYIHYRADVLTYYHFGLFLPKGKHPRARALAKQWLQQNPQPSAMVQQALQYFNQEPFVYTHTPPILTVDPIDEFLFETRQGFCEHYAAAFTVLMRAAGIPARIVTGYLGGMVNPIGHYLTVRQRDAHAWSEVWLPDQGWVRVDPTAAIAPERIEAGIDVALPEPENLLGVFLTENSTIIQILQNLSYRWDVINNTWNQWIVDYNSLRQQHLISQLGLKNLDWRGMAILLAFTITILLFLATWILLRPPIKIKDPAQQIYQRFCKKLARRGLPRYLSEGPLTFANRISTIRPDLAHATNQIIELYLQTRYRSQSQILEQLRLAVQKFHP